MITAPTSIARLRGHRRLRGLTLFGVVMSLLVAAAAVIGTVTLYNTAQDASDRNDAQALLTHLMVSTQGAFQSSSQYPDGSSLIPAVDARNGIPGTARVAGTPVTIEHPYGGAVTITGKGATFEIVFADLAAQYCVTLLDPYVGQSPGRGVLQDVTVTNGGALTPPFTATQIATACANDDDKDVGFEFR